MKKIAAVYVIKADIEGWAQLVGCTVEQAEEQIFAYLGWLNPVSGQSFLTLDTVTVEEDTL